MLVCLWACLELNSPYKEGLVMHAGADTETN